jgi:hypothetical protein
MLTSVSGSFRVNLDRPNHPLIVSYPIDQLPNRKLPIA